MAYRVGYSPSLLIIIILLFLTWLLMINLNIYGMLFNFVLAGALVQWPSSKVHLITRMWFSPTISILYDKYNGFLCVQFAAQANNTTQPHAWLVLRTQESYSRLLHHKTRYKGTFR